MGFPSYFVYFPPTMTEALNYAFHNTTHSKVEEQFYDPPISNCKEWRSESLFQSQVCDSIKKPCPQKLTGWQMGKAQARRWRTLLRHMSGGSLSQEVDLRHLFVFLQEIRTDTSSSVPFPLLQTLLRLPSFNDTDYLF